jgi:hypothetical protein
MRLEERERELLKLLDEYRDQECRKFLDAARAEAERTAERAYRRERARLHERVVAERAAARGRIQAVRAERDTRSRGGTERAHARILEQAWPLLRQTLGQRWQTPEGRRGWAAGAIDQARRTLPPGDWTIRHAPGWPEPERTPLVRGIAQDLGAEPRLVEDRGISAGLVVEWAGAALDATLDGLLRDRRRIEARLLALLQLEANP